MCFDPPKPPSTTDPVADPELARQRKEAEIAAAEQKAQNKQTRTEQQLAILAGRIGRKSLFSGGQGGEGFGPIARRSLMTPSGGAGTPPGSTVQSYVPGQHYSFYDLSAPAGSGGNPAPAPGGGGPRGGVGGRGGGNRSVMPGGVGRRSLVISQ